jgi:phage virion morphogenesis protein
MAGAGIEVGFDDAYQKIIEAFEKASGPALEQIAQAGGLALQKVSAEAFRNETDPATGAKWKERKDKSITRKLLVQRGTLRRSITFNASSDGSVTIGSNLVYAGIHQWGGKTKAHDIKARNAKALHFNGIYRRLIHHPGSDIPARPYLGVPKDFDRQFFDDPAIQTLLGIAGGEG